MSKPVRRQTALFAGLFGAAAIIVIVAVERGHAQAQTTAPRPAYYIADFELKDPEGIKPYSAGTPATLEPYGGRFIARGGRIGALEGAAPGARSVIIAFPSMEQAQAWYNSEAYRSLRPIRQRSGISRTFIIEGLPN